MDFVIGALVGAGALAVAIAVSMAKAAKESDEIGNELKEDNNRLQRENAFLKNQLELRARIDDMVGEHE